MNVISVTKDHAVQIGGTGAPQKVTVLAGHPVGYATDRNGPIVGLIEVGESQIFDQSAWMQSPGLSDVRVEEAHQPTVIEALEAWKETESRLKLPARAPETPPKRFSRLYVPAAVVLGAGWLAGVLGAVGILH